MFSRLFNLYLKKEAQKGDSCQNWKSNLDAFQAQPSLPMLDEDKIRVLVFRECVKKTDKTLLFDSDAIILTNTEVCGSARTSTKVQVEASSPTNSLDNNLGCSPPKYKRIKPNSDIKILGEMIFGSVPMIYKGSIQKVHLISTPPQLLMTKVFALRSRSAGVNFCDNEMASCSLNATTPSLVISGSITSKNSNVCEKTSRSHSNPAIRSHKRTHSNPTMRSNVRRSSEMSNWSSDGQNHSFDSPCGSLQRRYARSMMTSLDSTDILRTKTEQSEENRVAYRQQPKIAIGIIFKLWEDNDENNRLFQDFFFSHYTLFESHLQTFRVKIEKSFYLRKNFTDVVLKATETFKHDILSLCFSPRIIEPVWLNLMILADEKHTEVVNNFVNTFINVVKRCERKQNNYFLSILLSAVLTHNPSWVATVMPSTNSSAKRSYLDKHSSNELDVLARCHPYNPLWAQLCDMYGSVNSPRKLSRTIVVGENASLVVELLYLLTYFLRCSNINENDLHIEPETTHVTTTTTTSSYMSYTSSWNEAMFSESGTPLNVCSWIDNVSCVGASEMVNDNLHNTRNETVNLCKTNVNLCKTNNLSCKQDIEKENDIIELDTSRCYCGYLRRLDSTLGRKNFINILKSTKKESLLNILGSTQDKQTLCNNIMSNNMNISKSCHGCRTLEKTIFEKYCDKCNEILNNISLEVDTVCKYCVLQLEKLSGLIHDSSSNDKDFVFRAVENENIFSQRRNSSSENVTCRKSSSSSKNTYCEKNDLLQRPCCSCGHPQSGNNNNTCDVNVADKQNNHVTSARKLSHPMDCTPSPELNGKVLRHSTTSHDSGTEMACSLTSSCPEMESADSMNLTRDNSVSSRDNLFSSDTLVGDLDSDYCSVENEQTSTVSEVMFESDLINTVCKSTSSTTIKEIYVSLDSSTMNTIIDTTNETNALDTELESLNLKQVQLPLTAQTQVERKTVPNATGLSTFGSSLLAGYCDSYVPDFVLHGTRKLNEEKLAIDLQNSIKHSILDEQVYDASCVVANTDTWTCEVWNLSRRTDSVDHNTCESLTRKPVVASSLVSNMIESTKQLYDMEMPAKFCLLHLEEQLKDLYHRSRVLSDYAVFNPKHDVAALPKSLSVRASDMELLTAVCMAQSPILCDDVL